MPIERDYTSEKPIGKHQCIMVSMEDDKQQNLINWIDHESCTMYLKLALGEKMPNGLKMHSSNSLLFTSDLLRKQSITCQFFLSPRCPVIPNK